MGRWKERLESCISRDSLVITIIITVNAHLTDSSTFTNSSLVLNSITQNSISGDLAPYEPQELLAEHVPDEMIDLLSDVVEDPQEGESSAARVPAVEAVPTVAHDDGADPYSFENFFRLPLQGLDGNVNHQQIPGFQDPFPHSASVNQNAT